MEKIKKSAKQLIVNVLNLHCADDLTVTCSNISLDKTYCYWIYYHNFLA